MLNYEQLKKYSSPILRITMALVFLWFSVNQFLFPDNFIGYLPGFLMASSNPSVFIYANAALELVFGMLLILGIFTRISALILSVHLLGIIFSLGYNEVAVRDFGLMMATFAVFLNGPDFMCLKK